MKPTPLFPVRWCGASIVCVDTRSLHRGYRSGGGCRRLKTRTAKRKELCFAARSFGPLVGSLSGYKYGPEGRPCPGDFACASLDRNGAVAVDGDPVRGGNRDCGKRRVFWRGFLRVGTHSVHRGGVPPSVLSCTTSEGCRYFQSSLARGDTPGHEFLALALWYRFGGCGLFPRKWSTVAVAADASPPVLFFCAKL